MKHVILIGFMGCGKSRVGRQLAKEMRLPFVDMDAEIVKEAGMAIAEIFAEYGEAYFRKLETEMLQKVLARKKRSIISAGGGVAIQERNWVYLEEATVVYLKTSVDTLVERLSGDKKRPILQGGNLRGKIVELKRERDPIYERVSDIRVETSDRGVDEIVWDIVAEL